LKNIFAIICLVLVGHLTAQKYNTLGGIRIGDDFGVSFAQRIANKNTIELNIQPGTFAGNNMSSILVKQHYSLLTKRFNFFMGAGVYHRSYQTTLSDVIQNHKSYGAAFTFGAEFTIGRLSISTDYVPLVTFNHNTNQKFYTTSGFSMRYVLVGRESSTKKFFRNIFKKKR
jgi:hypothetical protein